MKDYIKFRFTGILIMLVTYATFALAIMLLWNVLLPQIFVLPQIDYLQAAGLFILARLLFGGLGGGWHAGGRGPMRGRHLFHHGNKLRKKWMNMSEEERKEFMEKEKEFFDFHRRCSHPHPPFHNGFPPPHDPFHNDGNDRNAGV